MNLIVRLLVRIVILAALAVVLSFAIPVFVHRNADNKAVLAYINNPSAENNAILPKERAENQRVVRTTHLEAAGVLFALMSLGWIVIHKWPGKSPSPR
jgi:hypothetical protein